MTRRDTAGEQSPHTFHFHSSHTPTYTDFKAFDRTTWTARITQRSIRPANTPTPKAHPAVRHPNPRSKAAAYGNRQLVPGTGTWYKIPVRGCTKSTIFATKPFLASPPAPSCSVLRLLREVRPNASCCTRNTCWEAMVEGSSREARYKLIQVSKKFENQELF